MKCSAADAVELWLNIELPQKYQRHLRERQQMAFNQYSLCAFYLHHRYDNKKLSNENKNAINNFLFKHLNGNGIEEWDKFNEKLGIFRLLEEKNIENPLTFWRMARNECPNLSEFALKFLKIPASSVQLERVFSNWAQIHSPIRNRLTFERSKKLMHIYYTLRLKDNIVYENFEEEEMDEEPTL